jgi:predicted nuclease with TOPRIM domain
VSESEEARREGVERVLADRAAAEDRATSAEARLQELEARLSQLEGSELDASRLKETVGTLEAENEKLRSRIEEGRAGVEKLLSRIRFFENSG